MKTYATNDLWKTVAGPYTVKSWSDSGLVELTANKEYTGEDKPSIENVEFLPFTSADAEMNVVRSGDVDYGYVTSSQLTNEKQFTDLGYSIEPWAGWSITYMPYNFANPEKGSFYKQLYVRQALQHAIDQETISEVVWHGAATPDYGPIPQTADSSGLSDVQKDNPYPFDLKKAEKLFTDNGWVKGSDGTLECAEAGAAEGQCGEGIAAGDKAEIVVTHAERLAGDRQHDGGDPVVARQDRRQDDDRLQAARQPSSRRHRSARPAARARGSSSSSAPRAAGTSRRTPRVSASSRRTPSGTPGSTTTPRPRSSSRRWPSRPTPRSRRSTPSTSPPTSRSCGCRTGVPGLRRP